MTRCGIAIFGCVIYSNIAGQACCYGIFNNSDLARNRPFDKHSTMQIGLEQFRDKSDSCLDSLLLMPDAQGVYHIGELYARSSVVIGTFLSILSPKRLAS